MMKTILLDTNVLLRADRLLMNINEVVSQLIPVETEIAIHPYVEAEIIDSLLDKGKKGNQANFAMKIMSHFTPFLDSKKYTGTDTALLITAKREGAIIFTLDKTLKKRCLRAGIAVISVHKHGKPQLFGDTFF